jgi:thiosulfate/3-mercaptopyruvate sulfurtransferase
MADRPDRDPTVPGALIDARSLRARLGAKDLRILDCRHDLAKPQLGHEQYLQAHIPDAVFAHLDHDLSGPKDGSNGRHPLPDPEVLSSRLRSWGVDSASHVVAYDASEGSFAARAWWLLRWLGHARVSVLDGGWQAWLAAGGPASTAVPTPPAGDFAARPSLERVATAPAVLAQVLAPRPQALLLDARAPDRYEGRNETIDPVAGHIPGAVNRFWKWNLEADGRFKPPAALRAEYERLLEGRAPEQVTVQCGSGVTACHDLLALHVAGLAGAALYAGSWSQWIADRSRPVAVGPAPR